VCCQKMLSKRCTNKRSELNDSPCKVPLNPAGRPILYASALSDLVVKAKASKGKVEKYFILVDLLLCCNYVEDDE